jgi:ribosome-associated heat shock protein Hsp15
MPEEAIRLDKWLWQARFCKTRGLAARLIAAGAVRVNAVRVAKPATPVRVGDGLSFALGGRVHAVRIMALGARRGPAPEARALYADLGADLGADQRADLGADAAP